MVSCVPQVKSLSRHGAMGGLSDAAGAKAYFGLAEVLSPPRDIETAKLLRFIQVSRRLPQNRGGFVQPVYPACSRSPDKRYS